MKRLSALLVALVSSSLIYAQNAPATTNDTLPPVADTTVQNLPVITPEATPADTKHKKKKILPPLDLSTRSKDHLLLQVGYDSWANKPDSFNTKGLSRSFNMYLMFDFPFKTNPHLSVGIGAGISTSNMYFSKTYIDITGKDGNKLSFEDVSDTTHFKKYKLMTTYLEAPVELRYVADPYHPKRSFKAAAGVKIGTMLGAGTKGKNLLSSTGQSVRSYVQKEKSKRFFNTTRMSATARVGYGAFSVFGSYQLNPFIKDGYGPDVRPFTIGLTLSGL